MVGMREGERGAREGAGTFLWHLERQNLKTLASLRTKVMPVAG